MPWSSEISNKTNASKFILTSGPHAGLKGYVAVPATHFPFERLPLEIRQRVYKILFPQKDVVSIDRCRTSTSRVWVDMQWCRYTPRETAILSVNRAINAEAIEYIYRPTRFTSASMANLNDWLATIGSCRKHLTHVTIVKSGHNMTDRCYTLLADAVSLQSFEITLPGSLRATLDEHIERHWESLKNYLLAYGVNRAESLRRLDTVRLKIGPAQNGILNPDGDPMKEMTEARHDFCKTKIRGKVLEHFMRKAMEPRMVVKRDSDSAKTVQSVKREKGQSIRATIAKLQKTTATQSHTVSYITIDDD